MKFTPLLKEAAADPSALTQEYAEAEDFAPAKLGAAHFFFRSDARCIIFRSPRSRGASAAWSW